MMRFKASTGVLLLTILSSSAIAAPDISVPFPAQLPTSGRPNVIDDHFVGISWELSSFDTLWGTTPNQPPAAMQNYLHNLAARMSKPLRIRIGGNGMDGSTYVPDHDVVIQHVTPDTNFNDVPVNFGSKFFDVLNGMADKVGPMQFSIGLGMRSPNFSNPTLLAVDAQKKLGDKLDAFLLGNEPDLYDSHGDRPGYNIQTYISEVGNAMSDLEKAGLPTGQNSLAAGPTICCSWTLSDVLDAGFDKYSYKYYTLQHYPNNVCSGTNAENTNITYYLTHSNVGEYLGWETAGMQRAQQLGVPVILSEFNSVACGGTNISSTFSMSLWTIDVGLKAASMNYSAVYIHTREQGVQYNLFDPPSQGDTNWRTGSPYYGTLFLSEVTLPGGSIVVDLDLDNSTTDAQATVAGYGIYDSTGTTRTGLALINFADQSQVFTLPAGIASNVGYRSLIAPSVEERTNISWAGQTVQSNGELTGQQVTEEINCDKGCQFTLQGPGAVLLALNSTAGMFKGSSTTAPSAQKTTTTSGDTARYHVSLIMLTFIMTWCTVTL